MKRLKLNFLFILSLSFAAMADNQPVNELSAISNRPTESEVIITARKTTTFSIISSVVVIFTIGSLLNYRAKSYKNEKTKALNKLLLAEENLSVKLRTISEISQSADNILLSKFKDYDNMLSMMYVSEKPEIITHRINKKLCGLKRQLRENIEELSLWESYVNSCRNNLIGDFRNHYPKCTQRAIRFFLYKSLGLSDKSITVIMDEKITNVYNWKYRLRNMITKSDISAIDKDRFIKELCR